MKISRLAMIVLMVLFLLTVPALAQSNARLLPAPAGCTASFSTGSASLGGAMSFRAVFNEHCPQQPVFTIDGMPELIKLAVNSDSLNRSWIVETFAVNDGTHTVCAFEGVCGSVYSRGGNPAESRCVDTLSNVDYFGEVMVLNTPDGLSANDVTDTPAFFENRDKWTFVVVQGSYCESGVMSWQVKAFNTEGHFVGIGYVAQNIFWETPRSGTMNLDILIPLQGRG